MMWRVLATICGLALVGVFAAYMDAERDRARQQAIAEAATARADKLGADLMAVTVADADTYAALQRSNKELAACTARLVAIEELRK